jgi:GNAT superfamily N-acetyltransferase
MIPIQINLKKSRDLEAEKPFIYSSWLKSYGKSIEARRMSANSYFSNYKRVLEQIIEGESFSVVAFNPEDLEQIYGYAVFNWDSDIDVTYLHYIYVKQPFRGLQVASRLLKYIHAGIGEEPIVCTFANEVFDKNQSKLLLTYNPFMRS